MGYRENLEELCAKLFGGKSANAVICGDKDGEMYRSKNELYRIRHGEFNKMTRNTQRIYEAHFRMPWCEIVSYIRYGARNRDLPMGRSAARLRKKFLEERAPDLNVLLPFLNITCEEWDTALAGENEYCYFMSDELEKYVDLPAGYLRASEEEFSILSLYTNTHYFSEYPLEKAAYQKQKTGTPIIQSPLQDIAESQLKCKAHTQNEIRDSLHRIDNALVVKNRESGTKIFIISEEVAAFLFDMISAFKYDGGDTDTLLLELNTTLEYWKDQHFSGLKPT